jgi:hypothetical protein
MMVHMAGRYYVAWVRETVADVCSGISARACARINNVLDMRRGEP